MVVTRGIKLALLEIPESDLTMVQEDLAIAIQVEEQLHPILEC